MTASWQFSIGLSLAAFAGTLIVVSLLTPAYRDVAGTINGPTLKAAAAMEGPSCGQARTKAPEMPASYSVTCAGGFAGDDANGERGDVTRTLGFDANPRLALKPRIGTPGRERAHRKSFPVLFFLTCSP